MASSNIVTLTEQNFTQEVLQSTQPIFVDFWAEWCGPCKMISPMLDELAEEYAGRVRIGKLNVDDHQSLAVQYGVRSVPTFLLFKEGEVAGQVVGAKGKRDLQASLDRAAA